MKTYRVPQVLESIFLAGHKTAERNIMHHATAESNIMRQSEHRQFSFRRIWDINMADSDLTDERKRHVTLAVLVTNPNPKRGHFQENGQLNRKNYRCVCAPHSWL